MSEPEEQYVVYAWLACEEFGGFQHVWDGTYSECVDFVNSPQSQLDLEMGLYSEFQILDTFTAQVLLSTVGHDGTETIH